MTTMLTQLMAKLSSYNIFNNLFPGILFPILLSSLTKYSLLIDNFILAAFLYYFIGLIISRIGSLFVEPFLKLTKFLRFAEYKDFVSASKKDEKIEILSETNNMYRTITAMLILLFLAKLFELISLNLNLTQNTETMILFSALFLLFLFSYRKQTNYITKRINLNK